MPILSEPGFSILEEVHRGRKFAEIFDQKSVGRVESLGVFGSGFESEQAGFFDAVRREYLRRAEGEPTRFRVLDGTQAPAGLSVTLTEWFTTWNG